MNLNRWMELAAMLMIGDGVLGVVEPRRHALVWRNGPGPWQDMVNYFADRPGLTRCVGAAEVAAGLWLAWRAGRLVAEDRAPIASAL